MAALLRGRAIVPNAAGITLTAGIVSATAGHLNQSFRGSKTSDRKETLNGTGDAAAIYYHNGYKRCTLTVVPCAVSSAISMAEARTNLSLWLALDPGTLVTVVDSDGTIWDGNYNLVSCNESRGSAEPGTVEVELENGLANDLTGIPA